MDQMTHLFQGWSFTSVFFRLFIAAAAGILIGMDREYKNKGAGIKTHALVCLGAALCMTVNEYALHAFPGSNTDITRMGAQVISGIGFLGVGTIIITRTNEVKGVTTAAGLWVCAGIGLAAGIGFWEGTVIAIILFLLILKTLEPLDKYLQRNSRELDLYVEFEGTETIKLFLQYLRASHSEIRSFNLLKKGNGPKAVSAVIGIQLREHKQKDVFLERIRTFEGILYAEEL